MVPDPHLRAGLGNGTPSRHHAGDQRGVRLRRQVRSEEEVRSKVAELLPVDDEGPASWS